jgi:hypothetical protein
MYCIRRLSLLLALKASLQVKQQGLQQVHLKLAST